MLRSEASNNTQRQVIILCDAFDHVLASLIKDMNFALTNDVYGNCVAFVWAPSFCLVNEVNCCWIGRPNSIANIIRYNGNSA